MCPCSPAGIVIRHGAPMARGITTRRGDRGWTDLRSGARVRKTDLRVEALGTLDEVVSLLGLARCCSRRRSLKTLVRRVQEELFVVGAEIAATATKAAAPARRVDGEMMSRLERELAEHQARLKAPLHGFVLPGEGESSARLDVARAVCRRLERAVWRLKGRHGLANRHLFAYLNRLSDLLFVLARLEGQRGRA